MFWDTKAEKEIEEMRLRIEAMTLKIEALQIAGRELDKIVPLTKDEKERLADLEVKMSKLWGLLLETTPSGKEKVSKFGRRFGGKSKGYI